MKGSEDTKKEYLDDDKYYEGSFEEDGAFSGGPSKPSAPTLNPKKAEYDKSNWEAIECKDETDKKDKIDPDTIVIKTQKELGFFYKIYWNFSSIFSSKTLLTLSSDNEGNLFVSRSFLEKGKKFSPEIKKLGDNIVARTKSGDPISIGDKLALLASSKDLRRIINEERIETRIKGNIKLGMAVAASLPVVGSLVMLGGMVIAASGGLVIAAGTAVKMITKDKATEGLADKLINYGTKICALGAIYSVPYGASATLAADGLFNMVNGKNKNSFLSYAANQINKAINTIISTEEKSTFDINYAPPEHKNIKKYEGAAAAEEESLLSYVGNKINEVVNKIFPKKEESTLESKYVAPKQEGIRLYQEPAKSNQIPIAPESGDINLDANITSPRPLVPMQIDIEKEMAITQAAWEEKKKEEDKRSQLIQEKNLELILEEKTRERESFGMMEQDIDIHNKKQPPIPSAPPPPEDFSEMPTTPPPPVPTITDEIKEHLSAISASSIPEPLDNSSKPVPIPPPPVSANVLTPNNQVAP